MGTIKEKTKQDEAMDLALLLYDIYNEAQIDERNKKGQIDAISGNDDN